MFERREIATLSELQFLFEVTSEIMVPRELNRRTERCVGLDKNFTGLFAAPCAPRHLCEELESPFTSSEIRKVQSEVGIDDSNERHIRKVQTFRDHLSADEHIDFPGAERSQRFTIRVFARHRICVHPPDDRFRKNLADVRFHFLGPEPRVNKRILAAGRAFFWNGRGVSAKMAT